MPISPELQAKIDSLSYDLLKKRIMDVLSESSAPTTRMPA